MRNFARMRLSSQSIRPPRSKGDVNGGQEPHVFGGLGRACGVGGWPLTPFPQKIDPVGAKAPRRRAGDELKTTFASHYTSETYPREGPQPGDDRRLQPQGHRRQIPDRAARGGVRGKLRPHYFGKAVTERAGASPSFIQTETMHGSRLSGVVPLHSTTYFSPYLD